MLGFGFSSWPLRDGTRGAGFRLYELAFAGWIKRCWVSALRAGLCGMDQEASGPSGFTGFRLTQLGFAGWIWRCGPRGLEWLSAVTAGLCRAALEVRVRFGCRLSVVERTSIYSILPPIRGELGTYPISLSDVMLPPQVPGDVPGRPGRAPSKPYRPVSPERGSAFRPISWNESGVLLWAG